MNERRWPMAALAAAGLLFVLLATANSAGYRYGASDQAFQVPAVERALNSAAFPRDTVVIDAQARLMLLDDVVAQTMRLTGLSMETMFLVGYLLTMALLWMGIVLIGQRVSSTPWAIVVLGAVVTLRHRIPRTSANSIEPYFYPRTLAFALGALAIAALLRRRYGWTIGLVGVAALAHVTTGAWFAILLGVAGGYLDARLRRLVWTGVIAGAAVAIGMALSGRLQPLLAPIDAEWLRPMTTKDSLFPNEWPAWAWAANLATPLVLLTVHRIRTTRGVSREEDGAIVWGTMALVAVFLATVPLVAWRSMLPTQLQIPRVFWLVDFVTAIYAVALAVDIAASRRSRVPLRALVTAALLLSVARGAFVMLREHGDRSLFQTRLVSSDWTDAMGWLARQPIDVHVLADPGHALRYGSSVRVAAGRDVLLDDAKDTALALYSREVALRVQERRTALGGDFDHLSSATAASLARTYGVDYLVTAGDPLDFPLAYANRTFRIYDMRRSFSGSR